MRNYLFHFTVIISISIVWGCKETHTDARRFEPQAIQKTEVIRYQNKEVALVIDKPALKETDVILVFHGTVWYDSLILNAAQNSLQQFKQCIERDDIVWVSVAYPEENLLFGDNLAFCEAALLWILNESEKVWGYKIRKLYLAGHSQGGYLVTRLNTLYKTDGVIANAPGPLDLRFRCYLEEEGRISAGYTCSLLSAKYGTTSQNPQAYMNRSLLHFTQNQLSPILLIQGMEDGPIQMRSWPMFSTQIVEQNPDILVEVVEIEERGHNALFVSPKAQESFNSFIVP